MVEDRVFSWYVFGALISIISPTLLCVWNLCCQHVRSGVQSWVWQRVSLIYGIEEHQFYNVSNIGSMTRVLRQAGLRTGRYRWTHDANVETGDAFQVGSLRVPSHSWFVSFLALLGFTHFVWVKDDGSEIHVIAPERCITTLLRVSNAAANRQATPEEVQELQLAFGGDVNSLSLFEYRCVCFERLFCAVLCLSADICLHVSGIQTVWLRRVVIFIDIVVASFVVYLAIASISFLSFSGSVCSRYVHTFDQLFRRRVHSQDGLQHPVLPEPVASAELSVSVCNEVMNASQLGGRTLSMDGSLLGRSYSIVTPRKGWYEVGAMLPFDPVILQKSPLLSVNIGVCFCAVQCCVDLIRWAAHTFAGEEDLLYVIPHNPMRDVDFVEVKELLGKASRGVALLVILPACEHLSSALEGSDSVRFHLGKSSRNVSSLADFSRWLSNLSSGLFHKVVVILPFIDQDCMTSTALWLLLRSHLPQLEIFPEETA